ncbi:CREB-regulated transcription coactivator 2 isoform X1 [Electrophorus electricus]|uniref:CREB-regulated transcription coactivator 2 isoform X1 n=1 Tax=Electrophorus electricus TaxID=8005 RepID=UPI0015D066A0|nr:CREB-regulated transcription coactivator 2 isoform X1 [Electrophorus electricus]XP_026867908.2 CREB-regulated transcription coactivator 2 isoform X1 [Electrophorus electricus]XP_026867909.2 CREB-regulated transcription coactivator 2 isoform X1 [Electrophorus electricus]
MKSNNEFGRNRDTGPGRWPGTGSASFTCNPRKFSEKIALHNQRQAEDTAAFQEVMMDITSTRIQAQRARQARSLAPYGGSLPNVNHISKSADTQSLDCSFATQQQHLRPDHGKRDVRAGALGRPNRRHTDSAPYLSFQLSPHSSSIWRRNWSSRSVNEKSQVDQLPVTTLNRTNSDSALHTSVRITNIGDTNPTQVLTACSRKSGQPLFLHPVPRIQENVQEEGMFNSQKLSSMLPGCDTSGKHVLCAPEVSCSFPDVPSLSTSGSLPDLSSLHLPSAVSELLDPDPRSHTSSLCSPTSMHHLLSTPAHSTVTTGRDFPLPSLSSSLQLFTSSPLLPSSLSNPNLQSTLSSHSLPNSLSSTALCLSLSNSSRKASYSNQSLQSSLSSSSLSNQSLQSATSHCSYSSGIGGSRSCSSSSLSCSPHASGQVTMPHTTSSRKRTQLNPLIMPSGGESLWQQPKQFSPNVSQTLYSITQGVPLNTNKMSQETKQLTYCYSQLPPPESPVACQSLQHHQPETWLHLGQETSQKCQNALQQSSSQSTAQPQYSQHQQATLVPPSDENNSQQHLVNPQQHASQHQVYEQKQILHHQYQQAQYPQRSSLYHQHCLQTQEYIQQQSQQHPLHHHTQSLQHHEEYEELKQCWNPQVQLLHPNQYQQPYQYQSQHEGPQYKPQQLLSPPNLITAQDKDICWQNPGNQKNLPNMTLERPRRACARAKEMPKLQSKMSGYETRREKTARYPKVTHSQRSPLQFCGMASTSSLDQEYEHYSESYTGLYLTPSQTEALSQKLGQLYKEPSDITRISDTKFEDVEGKDVPVVEHFRHLQTQSHSDEGLQSLSSIIITVPSACIDDESSDLPVSVSEFKLEPFAMGE